MEDVVLHYQPGSASRLNSLIETTEKLLEPFSCRAPPVFTPWFLTSPTDHRLPIRPARPAPVITSLADLNISDTSSLHSAATESSELQTPKGSVSDSHRDILPTVAFEKTQQSKDMICVAQTHNPLHPLSLHDKPESSSIRVFPDKDKDCLTTKHCPIKRSWSVFTQRGVLLQSSQSPSQHFTHMVHIHSLHLRQRVRWVIRENNCGAATSIQQVWRTLSRSVRNTKLPTCNANIQRERAEIWVFCDVLYAEQVGCFLKDELQLSGRISLWVHRLGNVFSL